MSGYDIRLERVVNVTPSAAFKHWVDAGARRHWYAPDDGWVVVESDTEPRVGGAWRVLYGPTRDELYLEHGVFEEFDPPHRVVYTNWHEYPVGRPSYQTRVTATFEADEGGTLLTLLDCGYPTKELRDENEGGWPDFLDAFERTLDVATPPPG